MDKQIHIFENAGLGKAPFHVVGMYSLPSKTLAEQNPTAYMNALRDMPQGVGCGMCAYCGHDLINNFIIQSSDNKKFVVGSECVNKAGDKGMVSEMKLIKNKIAREKRFEKQRAEIAVRVAEANSRREAAEAIQRKNNNGYTDEEIIGLKLRRKIKILAPLAQRLADGKGGFRDSIAEDLKRGELPRGRGMDIMMDILAKRGGRQQSKGYIAEWDQVNEIIHESIKPIENISDLLADLGL